MRVTFDIKCNRSLSGPLVSTNCTHIHPVVSDCGIPDIERSLDDEVSSSGKGAFLLGPGNYCDNVLLWRTLKRDGLAQANGAYGRCHLNPRGSNNTPRFPLDRLERIWRY